MNRQEIALFMLTRILLVQWDSSIEMKRCISKVNTSHYSRLVARLKITFYALRVFLSLFLSCFEVQKHHITSEMILRSSKFFHFSYSFFIISSLVPNFSKLKDTYIFFTSQINVLLVIIQRIITMIVSINQIISCENFIEINLWNWFVRTYVLWEVVKWFKSFLVN